MNHKIQFLWVLMIACLWSSCRDEEFGANGTGFKTPITLSGEIDQLYVSRVNDNGFADRDIMGVYIVDYEGSNPGTLQNSGNRGTNIKHTFDEESYHWNSAYDVYWKDSNTHIDVYGYYPFGSPSDVNAYPLTIQKDQDKAAEGGNLGGYEASDFLWGKVTDVAPTEKAIRLPLRHCLSNIRVTLKEGEGFAEGEWVNLEKDILVQNTVREGTVNLADGSVTLTTSEVPETDIIPSRRTDEFRAIVLPQKMGANVPLFSITVDGVVYSYAKPEGLEYIQGKMHTFTMQVNKKSMTGEYEFKLISESITPWEADLVSHDATAKEYIIIDSKAGKVPEGYNVRKLYQQAEAASLALASHLKIETPDPYLTTLGGALVAAADGIWDGQVWLHGAIGWRMPLSGWRAAYTGDALGWHDRARTHFNAYAASQVTEVPNTIPHPAQDSTLALARSEKKWGTPQYSNGYICRNPRRNDQMHHYDMNLCYIDELLWHFNWTGDLEYARRMWPVLTRHLAWEKRNYDPDNDGLYDAYACIWASDALYYNSGASFASHSPPRPLSRHSSYSHSFPPS